MEKNLKNRNISIIMALVFTSGIIIGIGPGFVMGTKVQEAECAKQDTTSFYDGEGNRLPVAAVKALVKEQYAHVSSEDSALVAASFPVSYDWNSAMTIDTAFIYRSEVNKAKPGGRELVAYPDSLYAIRKK